MWLIIAIVFFFQMQYPLALVGSVNVHMFGLKYNNV